jgi:hypothetical protein
MFEKYNKINFLSPSVKLLAPYIVLIILLFGLSLYLFQNGYQRVSNEYQSMKKTNEEVSELEEKEITLREIDTSVLGQSDKTVIALPKDNPGTWVISQLKNAADDNELLVGKVNLGVDNNLDKISGMKLVFELVSEDGNIENVVNYLQTIEKISPITSPLSVVITTEEKEGIEELNIELTTSVYWSDYPTELPRLTEPVREITQKEQELLNKIISLKIPEFTELDPKDPSARQIPFNKY